MGFEPTTLHDHNISIVINIISSGSFPVNADLTFLHLLVISKNCNPQTVTLIS